LRLPWARRLINRAVGHRLRVCSAKRSGIAVCVMATDGDSADSAYVRARVEANVVQLRARVRELTDEVEHLRSTRSKVTTETETFVAYATVELKKKDAIINELRDKMRELEFEREVELRKLQQQMDAALQAAMSEHRAMEAELRDKLRGSEAKLERAQQYLVRRDELEVRIDVLQTTLDAERAAHKQAFQDLERKYLLEKAAVIKTHEAQYQELRRAARAEAQRSLDADTKRILLENKQMVRANPPPPPPHALTSTSVSPAAGRRAEAASGGGARVGQREGCHG